ncbi:MAG: hypothetical protein N2235_04505 [Fischerella sp.]|nr:hypothetical protein [Fischerella sp.]
MQPKKWKNFWTRILFASSSVSWYFISINTAWAAKFNQRNFINKSGITLVSDRSFRKQRSEAVNSELQLLQPLEITDTNNITKIKIADEDALTVEFSDASQKAEMAKESPNLHSQTTPTPPNFQSDSAPKNDSNDTQQLTDPLQLELSPTNIPTFSPTQKDQILETSQTETEQTEQRLQKLQQQLQDNEQPSAESDTDEELGKLRLREISPTLEQPQTSPLEQPLVQFQPIGYLLARVGYFYSSNIFSSGLVPVEDSLVYSGLSLGSVPIPLGKKTFLSGSIDGSLVRYLSQSKYNYNQVRFNLSLYQELTPRMYGEVGWSNQLLFYARDGDSFDAGDRFLNENTLRLSLGRRDPLTQKLMLDSFYEFRVSLTDPPEDWNRLSNFLWLSLNYYLRTTLQVGLDYQFSSSNFTERDRDDLYNRFFGHLNYKTSNDSSISVQAGVTLGDSSDSNIDFDGWFFGINYNLELGKF